MSKPTPPRKTSRKPRTPPRGKCPVCQTELWFQRRKVVCRCGAKVMRNRAGRTLTQLPLGV